ncbi:ring-1,2-phenylacetyl-CoA epoxidase subunit PaaB [Caldalkalibacillus uzonensis]|uniref:Ring-1,2-phenylacetyl-CoA epoxidase subunit PaaB n=1 Tax=Caldalkalibacillus uzonensis TaxID=353224 RepID=A0ABU0CRB8_9BACI|nr:1,2-phenylacetyl-CoA epoxidase subunit PaaB [Caldalkalibacillus uzonensis]MDQ0338965.1 ring-1,2-phenylacetyl-CoA epoxidase subunit PaaB [Caldalkalibacillus uzonensis]
MSNQQTKETHYPIYEVFIQRDANTPFVYQGSLLAPNQEVALFLAKENFARRIPCYNIWVVNREDIGQLPSEERESLNRMDNKDYRETKGYGYLKKRWRKYDQVQLTKRHLLS